MPCRFNVDSFQGLMTFIFMLVLIAIILPYFEQLEEGKACHQTAYL